jgi:redox-sensitive bicupin YhaK (pirin superfamily)
MLWSEEIPTVVAEGGLVTVDIIAGRFDSYQAPSPPPDSWGSQSGSDLAIWLIRLAPDGRWDLPPAPVGVNRMLHLFVGSDVELANTRIGVNTGVRLRSDAVTSLVNHGEPAEFLLLQGRPIGAPVFQMGPFVMNSAEEIARAIADYRITEFGGWPWDSPEPVHDRTKGRFALHADGRIEHRDLPSVRSTTAHNP